MKISQIEKTGLKKVGGGLHAMALILNLLSYSIEQTKPSEESINCLYFLVEPS